MRTKTGHTRGWLAATSMTGVLLLGAACTEDESTPAGSSGMGGMGGTAMMAMGTGGAPGAGGMGGGACPAEVMVTADISADTTWSCPKYLLTKKIYIVNNAKLTINPGTLVLGDHNITDPAAKAAIIASRGSQLIAKGTKDKPIVFTSSAAPGKRVGGDWGGLALLGSARINTGMPCASGGAGCKESGIEGIPATELRAKFGGADDASSCGTLEYIRVEFAGAELEPNRELNGITFGGCGSGTKVSHVQVHRGTDDGIEVFGGTVGMDHVVLSGNEDDSLDWDYGWTGKVQFLVVHQRAAIGDHGFEGASSPQGETLEPRANPTIFNATLIGRPDGGKAMHLKEGTRGTMRNLIVTAWNGNAINFTAKEVDLNAEWPAHLSIESSAFWMNKGYQPEVAGMPSDDDKGFDDQMAVEDPARKNKKDADPMLSSINDLTGGAAPNYVPKNAALGSGGVAPTFGDTSATYQGAFKPNDSAPWTDGWTAYPAN